MPQHKTRNTRWQEGKSINLQNKTASLRKITQNKLLESPKTNFIFEGSTYLRGIEILWGVTTAPAMSSLVDVFAFFLIYDY